MRSANLYCGNTITFRVALVQILNEINNDDKQGGFKLSNQSGANRFDRCEMKSCDVHFNTARNVFMLFATWKNVGEKIATTTIPLNNEIINLMTVSA